VFVVYAHACDEWLAAEDSVATGTMGRIDRKVSLSSHIISRMRLTHRTHRPCRNGETHTKLLAGDFEKKQPREGTGVDEKMLFKN
jgi:hypothetical protein